jgi:putative addiction module component (TIGR02574 family)
MSEPALDYRRLSLAERLQLVEDIWDSIAEEARHAADVLPLSDAQLAEARRRQEEHRRDPGSAIPWERVRAELFGRGG